jgi:hypothetical protein
MAVLLVTGAAGKAEDIPGLYNIFTPSLRYVYGSFMTAVAVLLILSAVYEGRDVRH